MWLHKQAVCLQRHFIIITTISLLLAVWPDNQHHDPVVSLIMGVSLIVNGCHELITRECLSTVWRTSLNVHSESTSVGQKRFRHLGRPVLCDRGYINQQLCLCGVIRSAVLIPEGQFFTNHTNTPLVIIHWTLTKMHLEQCITQFSQMK